MQVLEQLVIHCAIIFCDLADGMAHTLECASAAQLNQQKIITDETYLINLYIYFRYIFILNVIIISLFLRLSLYICFFFLLFGIFIIWTLFYMILSNITQNHHFLKDLKQKTRRIDNQSYFFYLFIMRNKQI